MRSLEPRKSLSPPGAALAALMLVAGVVAFAGCSGGNSCTQCPSYDDGTGAGWCKPGPDDCQACKVVVCPGYCLYNLATFVPVPCDGGGQ